MPISDEFVESCKIQIKEKLKMAIEENFVQKARERGAEAASVSGLADDWQRSQQRQGENASSFNQYAKSLAQDLADNKRDQADWVEKCKKAQGMAQVTVGSPSVQTVLTNDDLQRRIEILKAAGVREYRDGALEIVFERVARWASGRPATEEEMVASGY